MENRSGVTGNAEPKFTDDPEQSIQDGDVTWKFAGKPDEFAARVAKVLTEEMADPEQWHYLSFATDEDGFRGAAVVLAHGITDAVTKANALKINPGGEVLCMSIPEEKIPAEEFRNRLLAKEEIEAMWGEPCKTIREWDEEESK